MGETVLSAVDHNFHAAEWRISQTVTKTRKQPARTQVWKMFDRISARYDLLNRLLSFGQDVYWRKQVARYLPDKKDLIILDLATGTADQLLFLYKQTDKIRKGIGIDPAVDMLARGRDKIRQKNLETLFELKEGMAENIPFSDNSFDALTISFGIRNVEDIRQSLSEMYRVLKQGGRVLILEFSLPENRFLRQIYLFYFRHLLPRLGGLISGDACAYRYLNETVETFPYGSEFSAMLAEQGFQNVACRPLTLGVSTIYYGDKPLNKGYR